MKAKKVYRYYTTEEMENNAFERFAEKQQHKRQIEFINEASHNDPIRRVFATQKGILSRQKARGNSKITLPKLKFLENSDG